MLLFIKFYNPCMISIDGSPTRTLIVCQRGRRTARKTIGISSVRALEHDPGGRTYLFTIKHVQNGRHREEQRWGKALPWSQRPRAYLIKTVRGTIRHCVSCPCQRGSQLSCTLERVASEQVLLGL